MSLPTKLLRWLIFSVILALLPLVFNYLHVVTRGGAPTFDVLLGQGQLLLVVAAISGSALGNLFGSGKNWLGGKMVAGGGSLCILALSSYYFADITAASSNLNFHFIAISSLAFFACAVGSAAGCVALAEV